MMREHHEQLIAYLATLVTLVVVFLVAIIAGSRSPEILGKFEAFGLGTITGGLIGVLRIPANRNVTVDNPPNDPVPTTNAPDDAQKDGQ
jgi:hypothetical protein